MSRLRWALLLLLACVAAPDRVEGQGTCEVNNAATCIVAGSATQALRITVTAASQLLVPVGNIVLPSPETTALSTSFGVPILANVTVNSNTPWSVAVNAAATVWTATPGSARQNKPASDLQWGTSPGGGFASLTASPATVATGNGVAGGVVPLYLRVQYDFGLDRAGSYSLPITVVLTAP